MQRTLGLLLLALGTGLAAVFGAWLPGGGDAVQQQRQAAVAHRQMQAQVTRQLEAAPAGSAEATRLQALAALPGPAAPADLAPPRGRAAVRLWANEAGLPFGLGILLVVVGVVLARRGASSNVEDEAAAVDGPSTSQLFAELAAQTAQLCERYPVLAPESDALPDLVALRAEVEALQRSVVDPLVDRRDALSQSHGVAAFAEVYVPFATAERLLNRSWSACVDGYVDEVGPCLVRARDAAAEAARVYGRVTT